MRKLLVLSARRTAAEVGKFMYTYSLLTDKQEQCNQETWQRALHGHGGRRDTASGDDVASADLSSCFGLGGISVVISTVSQRPMDDCKTVFPARSIRRVN